MKVTIHCKKRNPMVFEWDEFLEQYKHTSRTGIVFYFCSWSEYKGPWIGRQCARLGEQSRIITYERQLGAIKAVFDCGTVIKFPPLVKRKLLAPNS